MCVNDKGTIKGEGTGEEIRPRGRGGECGREGREHERKGRLKDGGLLREEA